MDCILNYICNTCIYKRARSLTILQQRSCPTIRTRYVHKLSNCRI